jgi:cold shock CspA family protein
MTGIIRRWNTERGFGFILASNSREIFSHIRDWSNDNEIPAVGQMVEFEVVQDLDKPNKKKAVNVRLHIGTSVNALAGGGK